MKGRIASYRNVVAVMILCCYACDFQPDGVFFKEVPLPNADGITLDLTEYDADDTIYLFTSTKLKFESSGGDRTIYRTEAYLGKTQLNQNVGIFEVDPERFDDGIYKLQLSAYTRLGNNSLGDYNGTELKVYKEWTAVIDKSTPEAIGISASLVDGMVQLSWPRYKGNNFQGYVISKSAYSYSNNRFEGCFIFTSGDRNKITLRDSTFAGGRAEYFIQVKGSDKLGPTTKTTYEYIYDPQLRVEWTNDTDAKVTWRKYLLAGVLDKYILRCVGQEVPSDFVGTDPNDTTFSFRPTIGFGLRAQAWIELDYNTYPCGEPRGQQLADFHVGDDFSTFHEGNISYVQSLDKFFALVKDGAETFLWRIGSGGVREQSISVKDGLYTMSENGAYLYITYDNILRQIDPSDFTIIRTFNLGDLINHQSSSINNPNNFSVSNNGVLAFSLGINRFVLDPDFNVLLTNSLNRLVSVSPSGEYVLFNDSVYRWNGTAYEYYDVPGYPFRPTTAAYVGADRVVLNDDDKLTLVDLPSKTIIKSISIPTYPLDLRFDPVSNLVSFRIYNNPDGNILYVHDTNMDEVTRVLLAPEITNVAPSTEFALINSHILCSNGLIIPLSRFYP